MKKRWICQQLPDPAVVEQFASKLSIEKPLASLLLQRGINTPEAANAFFNPDINMLHDPFLMKDMDKAVRRLSKAIINNEKILVYYKCIWRKHYRRFRWSGYLVRIPRRSNQL